jgi:hypothetical protein
VPQLPAPVRERVHLEPPSLPAIDRARAELIERAVRLASRRPGEAATESEPVPSSAPEREERSEEG